MRQVLTPLVVLALGVTLASCGNRTTAAGPAPRAVTSAGALPDSVPVPGGRVTTRSPATVLDDGDGPQLCLGGLLESLPPQCGGLPVAGWSWPDHDGDYEEVRGTRWGDFVVSGTFDGVTFTAEEVVPADEYDAAPVEDEPFETACDEPAAGWVVDPGRVRMADFEAAMRTAQRLEDFAGSFVDTSRDPRSPEQMDQDFADGADDVSSWIVNVAVTGDLAAAEAAVREVWGGGVCVTTARVTQRELLRVQRRIDAADVPGFLSSGVDEAAAAVHLGVVHDDGSIQAWADQEFGPGLVEVWSALVGQGGS